jgi:excisionase family DNA binding protein
MGRVTKQPEADAAPLPATRRFMPIAYRPDDAAELIGLSTSRVHELIAEGAIRARKCGRATIILHDDLYAYVTGLPLVEPSRKQAQ